MEWCNFAIIFICSNSNVVLGKNASIVDCNGSAVVGYILKTSIKIFLFRRGPLVHSWAMCFEATHSYFKKLVDKLNNFKNIDYSLAKRYQALQGIFAANLYWKPFQQGY
jgi:hypothetical protein